MEYGLIGARVGHSWSARIHPMLADYPYELLALPTEAEARAFLEKRAFKAINVTIPYKQLVIPYCDEVDPLAAEIGAVNTIVNRGGKLCGYNTDYNGFDYLARAHGVDPAGKTVLILGTGGTRRTVAAWCRAHGAREVLVAGRSGGAGGVLTYAQAMERGDANIIVNASPAGMYPENGSCLLDPARFGELEAVLDVVYNPLTPELPQRARAVGVPAWGGLEMLVAQAVHAVQHFTGRAFDADAKTAAIHKDIKREVCNVSLIGMPGSGKSTIAAALAEALGKKLVDLDAVIEQRAGMPIPDIFARQGEAAFRRREAAALADISKEPGQVIACGGGIVKTPGNNRRLRQNGPVLWVQRPVAHLATSGRPLSRGRSALRQMERDRYPLYDAIADATIGNTGTLDEALRQAMAAFEQSLDA